MRLVIALCLAASPAAAQTAGCDAPVTQSDMTRCAQEDWQVQDDALNHAYALARRAMRDLDAGLPQGQQGAEQSLRDAQRAWITFRDATCRAEGYAMHGGSAEPMLVYGCMARLTQVRAADLAAMILEF